MPESSENNFRSLIFATAGHVDHGKTSLVANITGTNTDTLAEEKNRGLTIVPGYAYHHFSSVIDGVECNNTLGFVDVPGHIDFINNMLAGVGAVDGALLVIAADDGIMPQTREHLAILDLLDVSRGAIALTKIDRCEPERIQTVIEEIKQLQSTTSLKNAPLFALSNETGDGIDELSNYLQSQFSDDSALKKARDDDQYFRYLIDRSFVAKGIGTVLTGSVRAGSIKTGSSLKHTATGENTKLRSARLDKTELSEVYKGQRAAMNVNLENKLINRGDWLIDEKLFHPINRLDATVNFIDADFKLQSSAQYHMHIGASHYVVNIRHLGDSLYQLKCLDLMIAHHDDRFIVRDPASQHTLGGGRVVDIFIPRRKRSSESRLAQLNAMRHDSFEALTQLLKMQVDGLKLQEFSICRNISNTAIERLLERVEKENIGFHSLTLEKFSLPVLLHENYYSEYRNNILSFLKDFHQKQANQQGISEPALSRGVDFACSHLLFHGILQSLLGSSTIKRTGTLLHLPSHKTSLSAEEEDFLNRVRPLLLKAGYVPPRTRELVEMTNIPLMSLERILRESAKAGTLIKVAENRYYLPETIMTLAGFIEQLIAAEGTDTGFSVIQFRDASKIGRNLCIEILEYFDSVGFTRRDGNSRFVRTNKENIFRK
ncbi:MAG: selenocysteine-specific translation elongation factor [Gammaproteobacteria bacterium]|nr:selenocysteine-specific translation elongation factor [Gammaproteobacteria bacterium]